MNKAKRKAQTKAKNATFWKMSKARRRVAIAKDVIAQIDAERYFGKLGEYLNIRTGESNPFRRLKYSDELSAVFLKPDLQCNVCGIGSVFCSMNRLGDRLSKDSLDWSGEYVPDLVNPKYTKSREYLERCFDKLQLAMIEAAFERDAIGGFAGAYATDRSVLFEAIRFGHIASSDPTKRLREIMLNIVKNKGEFVPTD